MRRHDQRFVVRRLIGAIPVLLIVAVGVFLLLEAAPGDAVDAYLARHRRRRRRARRAAAPAWGLDQSLPVRFLAYIQSVVTLDLGWSVAVGAAGHRGDPRPAARTRSC